LCSLQPLRRGLRELGQSADRSGISVGLLEEGLEALDISSEEDTGARNAAVLLLAVRFDYEATMAFFGSISLHAYKMVTHYL